LFWIFRQGKRETGVTLHFLDEGLDTGDIVFQAPVALPDGISGTEADRRCARRGAELMVDAVRQLQVGDLPRRPQPAGGSYYPWPTTADFRIQAATWSARRAFNFMRGTAEWNQPYVIEVAGGEVVVRTAVAYYEDKVLDQPLVENGRDLWVQCSPGVLHARKGG
jgi:methionyl-tRNA formyltransferase